MKEDSIEGSLPASAKEKPAKNIWGYFYFKLLLAFTGVIALYFIFMSLACAIPSGPILRHLEPSLEQLQKEGLGQTYFGQGNLYFMDNFSDAWMLNMAGSVDTSHPVYSAMAMKYVYASDGEADPNADPIGNLQALLDDTGTGVGGYARFWHGYQVALRVLLTFFTMNEIRALAFWTQTILASIAVILLARRIDTVTAVAFMLAMALVGFPTIAYSLMFNGIFIIALTSMILLLLWNGRGENRLAALFLFTGSFVCFIDLIAGPLLTFTLPMFTLLMLEIQQKKTKPQDLRYLKKPIKLGLLWCVGYLATWVAKWAIATLVLGQNVFAEGQLALKNRTQGPSGMEHEGWSAIKANLKNILPFAERKTNLIAAGILVAVILFTIVIFWKCRRQKLGIFLVCTAGLALLPYLWYLLAANHSCVHSWMAFRIQVCTLWILLTIGNNITPYKEGVQVLGRQRRAEKT